MIPELEEGLYFRTNREIYWNLPQAEGPRKRWTVPAGTRGVVRVDRSTREVGFAFDNMTHPEYGLAPTQRKPGMPILDWMTPVDKMKGPDAQETEGFTPLSRLGMHQAPDARNAHVRGALEGYAQGAPGRGEHRDAGGPKVPGAPGRGQGSGPRGAGSARA